jgi:hypothetical protein
MMVGTTSTVNSVGSDEDDEEEGYVNTARGEYTYSRTGGWRTSDDSWLELEDECEEGPVYHVNVIIKEEEELEHGNTSRENVVVV